MATVTAKIKRGSNVWVRCEIKSGMNPSERYFTFQVPNQLPITGFATSDHVKDDRVRAMVMSIVNGSVLLVFPGELISATNPVMVPKACLDQIAA